MKLEGSIKPQLTPQACDLFDNMTLAELLQEKRAALQFIRQGMRSASSGPGSYLYELTMMELGRINRNIRDLERCL